MREPPVGGPLLALLEGAVEDRPEDGVVRPKSVRPLPNWTDEKRLFDPLIATYTVTPDNFPGEHVHLVTGHGWAVLWLETQLLQLHCSVRERIQGTALAKTK
jgi:hypothetical protein